MSPQVYTDPTACTGANNGPPTEMKTKADLIIGNDTLSANLPGLWNYQFWHPGVHQTSKALHTTWGGGDKIDGASGKQIGALQFSCGVSPS